MRTFGSGRRLATAAVIAAAALGAAGPAQADGLGVGNPDCEQGAEGVVQQFREVEAKRGYDAAVKWWEKAWAKYHDACVV
jgi:hypothetical protein